MLSGEEASRQWGNTYAAVSAQLQSQQARLSEDIASISMAQAEDVSQCMADLKRQYPKADDSATTMELPKNCQRLGPIALNMTYQQVVKALGAPAKQENDSDQSSVLTYYPLGEGGVMRLSMGKGKLQEIEIDAAHSTFPFGFYGYHFGESIDTIRNKLGPAGVTRNRPGDVFMYSSFPIQFYVTEDRHIDGISISNPGF